MEAIQRRDRNFHTVYIDESDLDDSRSRQRETFNDENAAKEESSNFCSLVKTFMELSTLHGLSRLGDSSVWVRVLWFVAMSGAITALVLQVNGLITDYLKFNVITDVGVEQGDLTFPAVTVCNNRPFSAKKLVLLPLFANLSTNILDPATAAKISERLLKSSKELSPEELVYLGTNVENTVAISEDPEDDDIKIKAIPYQGSCFSIEPPPGATQMMFVFNFHLNDSINKYELKPAMLTFLKDSLEASHIYKQVNIIMTTPGKLTVTELTHDVVNRLNGSFAQCPDDEHSFFARTGISYEQDACRAECKFKNIASKCQCLFSSDQFYPFWPRKNKSILPTCNYSGENCAYKVLRNYEKCECKPKCHMKMYKQTMQITTDLRNIDCSDGSHHFCPLFKQVSPGNISKEWISKNIAASIIMLSSKPYKSYTQRPEYPLLHFLADIGGTMGFYLGASMLTYFELVQLFVSSCLYLVQIIRQKMYIK